MVPANSCKIPRVPHYSGAKLEIQIFAYATITLYGVLFHTFPLIVHSVMPGPTTPTEQAQSV